MKNTDKLTVVVALAYEPEGKARLESIAPDNEYIYCPSQNDVTPEIMRKADVIIGNVPPQMMAHAQKLKWFQSQMAGVDAYLSGGIIPENVVITNVTGAFGLAISEHMIGTVFELFKKLHLYRDNQNNRLWLDRGFVRQIEGSCVCVVGIGDIGGLFAKKMKALGAYTIGIKRRESEKPEYVDELYTSEHLDEVLSRADITALCLPNTPQTRGMFDKNRIAKMKDDSILINVGRGNAVDTDALCDALESGKLGGAALDVTDPEPLPREHRLWTLENAIITPHISGFFHLRKTYENIIDICTENYRRYVCGEPLVNVINKETGYVD